MNEKERIILREVVNRGGLLSPADLINGIAKQDRRSVENLVVKGYIEEVSQDVEGVKLGSTHSVNFYRATEKGLIEFSPRHQRLWFWLRGDVRTVIIAIITALVTTLITVFIERLFN